ncbi:MAG: hypothetical protein P9M15_01725 [Candidatus Electryoneaceae bacterium]|nr:hypothetical protein [Candidatus Electryoneaceae bacterium]
MRPYNALVFCSGLFKVLGILAGIVSFLPLVSSLVNEFSLGNYQNTMGIPVRFLFFLGSAILGVTLYAIGEGIVLFVDMAENIGQLTVNMVKEKTDITENGK